MNTFYIPEQRSVVMDGHSISRSNARIAAYEFLVVQGTDEDQADAMTDGASVSRAWWGNEEVGFVGEAWEGATPITVVNCNLVGLA